MRDRLSSFVSHVCTNDICLHAGFVSKATYFTNTIVPCLLPQKSNGSFLLSPLAKVLNSARRRTKSKYLSIMAPLLVGIVALETIMALILAATKGGHRLL